MLNEDIKKDLERAKTALSSAERNFKNTILSLRLSYHPCPLVFVLNFKNTILSLRH